MSSDQAPRVFISYSHDTADHVERVRALADRLRRGGVDAWIDQYEPVPVQGWPRWMEEQVAAADFVLCVCTKTYRRRFDQQEGPGRGLGVTWEGALLRIHLYLDRGENQRFVPVIFEPEDEDHIPLPLRAFSYFQATAAQGYEALYRHLTAQPAVVAPPLGRRKKLSRKSFFGEPFAPGSGEQGKALAAYTAWAKRHYAYLELIGVDAGDVHVALEEVYVPLRMVHHEALADGGMGLVRGTMERGAGLEREDVEIESILESSTPRHALIFGEPGSGKTTALRKLHQLCWAPSPEALGLAAGTVPVFLRLRQLRRPLLDAGLAACIEHEIAALTGGRLQGLGEALWRHGRLLLLFDGLDEIADAKYRAEVLRRIGWYLGQDEAANVRAVVSCRRLGLPPRQADRDQLFRTFEVRPFQDEQIATLVKQWFRELARRGRITPATADQRVAKILDALTDRQKAGRPRWAPTPMAPARSATWTWPVAYWSGAGTPGNRTYRDGPRRSLSTRWAKKIRACAPCGAVAGGATHRICGRRSATGTGLASGSTTSASGCCARPRAWSLDPCFRCLVLPVFVLPCLWVQGEALVAASARVDQGSLPACTAAPSGAAQKHCAMVVGQKDRQKLITLAYCGVIRVITLA